ncbi:hypothetical protein M5E82_17950 [Parabacteroides distasonis]|nr:hypothetical protein M5E82_17950 [Parabacteroides distasonis]
MDILRTKYLLSYISYEGIHRREKLVYPYEALREALLNSIIHREYFVSSEIQVRVYEDKLVIGNEARLHDITVEDLSRPHPSRPHNKLIADVFTKLALSRVGDGEHNVLLTTAWQKDYPLLYMSIRWVFILDFFS